LASRTGIELSTWLDAAPDEVWERIATPEGINDELRPWLRMTVPGGGDLNLNSIEVGKTVGRSWVLLFGLVPIDYDEITIAELDRGSGFTERSTMLSQRAWEHMRAIRPAEGGSRLTDSITWEPRLPLPAAALRPLFRTIFGHRHRRLVRRFGGGPAGGAGES
jgi:ligand-binding SRPBCC domain-containing protein